MPSLNVFNYYVFQSCILTDKTIILDLQQNLKFLNGMSNLFYLEFYVQICTF